MCASSGLPSKGVDKNATKKVNLVEAGTEQEPPGKGKEADGSEQEPSLSPSPTPSEEATILGMHDSAGEKSGFRATI